MPAPRHVFRVHIRATPDEVWQAITDPAFTRRYFHRTSFESALEPGTGMRYVLPDGRDAVVGEIEVAEPPHRLAMTWRALYDPTMAEEPPSRVEWHIADAGDGITAVTTIHRDLARSPATSASVGTDWIWILDSMKSLLETGTPLPADEPEVAAADDDDGEWHRAAGVEANNSTWELLERGDLSPDDVDDLLGARRARPPTTGAAPRAGDPRTRRGRPGWCLASTPCSATVTSLCTTPIAPPPWWPRPGCRTSTWRTPTRLAPVPWPASAGSTRPRPSSPPPARCRSSTMRIARSSATTSPPGRGSSWSTRPEHLGAHGLGTVGIVSLKIEIAELAKTLDPYGFAYLVTVGDGGRAHVLAVTPALTDEGLVVGGVGRHSQANATERPDVTLVWPPTEAGGFSLLVDGTATVDGETITVVPAKATLHRPAPGPDGLRAGSDCVAVPLEADQA